MKNVLNEEWLTTELVNEIIDHLPSDDDISRDKETNIPHCTNDTFAKKCKNIFPIGRMFCNYRQLDQYVKMFLES